MQTQCHFKRHLQSFFCRIVYRTATQVIHRQRAGIDVVRIIILSFTLAVYRIRHSGPLCPVARSFQVTGYSAHLSAPHNVSHTATKTDCIGTNHSFLGTFVTQHHHAVVVPAFIEFKGTQIYPGPPSHLLVDLKFRHPAVMEHQVLGIRYALRQGLITYVHCISPFFRNIRNPLGKGFFRLPLSRNKAGGTVCKRVIVVGILLVFLGKTRFVGILPAVFFIFHFQIMAAFCAGIVVHNHFMTLPVALTWRKNHCPRILQHRNQVRHHERLRKQVFRSTEQSGPLPAPLIPLVPVHLAMALPQGYMPSLQSPADFIRT